MKTKTLILILFSSILSMAQNQIIGSVTYQLKSKTVSQEKLDYILEIGKKAIEIQRFELLFSNETSVFRQIDVLQSDLNPDDIRLFKKFYANDFSVNLKQNIIYEQFELDNQLYLIKQENIPNWELTNETKIIDNYLCYKATTYEEIIRDGKIIKAPIIAWYCPEIPFQFGPKNYHGLPGLILELHDRICIFYVSDFNLNPSQKNITLPVLKGKEKTKEEIKSIQENIRKKYFQIKH
jgi:GLPGLI family protein